MRTPSVRLICLFTVLGCCGSVWSQVVTATLSGNVTDSSEAVVPGAIVTATEINTGVGRTATTTLSGIYTIPYLTPGVYRVAIEAKGFKKFIEENVELKAAAVARVDAVLAPGNVTESIEVQGEAVMLQTDRAEVTRAFSSQAVAELPTVDRNFQNLASLTAGVAPPSVGASGFQEDPQRTVMYRVNGQNNSANNTQIDGIDNTEPLLGGTVYIPSVEVVSDVTVMTSNFSAEFGKAGGGIINVVTRGGTNHLHGSLWEFNRNTALRARNLYNTSDKPKPAFIRNEFGGALGGPIRKDKTFFYGSYQGRRLRQSSTTTSTLPVDAWRGGDFSAVPGLALFDPASGNADGTGRTPFAGNTIAPTRFAAQAKALLPMLVEPNVSGYLNNIIQNVPLTYSANSYDGRVDHNFGQQTKIFAKYNYSGYRTVQSSLLGPVIGDGSIADDYTTTASLNFTHGFSPTFLTEARAGFNRYSTNVHPTNLDALNKQIGISNLNPDDIGEHGLARIQVNTMAAIGPPVTYPVIDHDNIFTFVNNWSKIRSRHFIKWGVDVRRIRADRFQPQGLNLGPRGLFVFNPGTTQLKGGPGLGSYGSFANAFAAFLLGAPDYTGRTFMTVTPTNRLTEFFSFVHDTFQVTPKLTLDLGLRYEIYTTVKPRYAGAASNYDPTANSLEVAGIGGIPLSNRVGLDTNNFAPRVGISYRVNNKTVVRTGYGISYYTGRYGFTGGTLSTQFPVIYNVQQGVANDYVVDGTFTSLPVVPFLAVPSNGIIKPAPNQAFFTIPKNNPIPYTHSYSFTTQRQVTESIAFDIGYVGALGRQQPYNLELNAALPGTGSAGLPLNRLFGRTASTQLRADGVNNNYNSLQVNVNKRLTQGLLFTLSYTYSKAMDVGSDQASFMDNTNIRRNYGPASFDRTHMVNVSHVYELPFGKNRRFLKSGLGSYVLGDWQLNGILHWVTGAPFTATADATACNCPGNSQFADAVQPVTYLHGTGPGQLWFNTNAFAVPSANRFGNAGRDTIRGPGYTNYDFSVFRKIPVGERLKLEFRGEFYNLTNTPHFNNPAGSVGSATFGQITSSFGEREIQLALRVLF